MFFFFLNFSGGINPSVLPCLHSIYPSKFNSTSDIHMIDIQEDLRIDVRPLNRQPLGELLFEFFKYYAFFESVLITIKLFSI